MAGQYRAYEGRQSSQSGARIATQGRGTKLDTLRRLWVRPYTMQEIAAITQFPLSSICSLKHSLGDELEEVDEVEKLWPDGRSSTRTRWRMKG